MDLFIETLPGRVPISFWCDSDKNNFCAAHSPVRLDIETKFLISNY